jgi:WD40 repeat protein
VIVWAALGSDYAREISARMGKGASQPEVLAIGCPPDGKPILHPVPYAVFCGHKADVIDVAWSRGNFLLSASIDKTARLWHLSKPRCLMVFQHTDFVTAVAFHPIEDRYFLSGSFDRKLRIWNIPHHKVVEWTRTPAIVTSAAFSPDGYTAVAGLYQGQVILYHTEQLRYKTQLDCRNRSGKDSGGRKVTGVCYSDDGCYLLVTTNDSRLRLYNTDDFRMVSKYKGLVNSELQIKARLGPGYTRILSGSEDGQVYLWDVSLEDRKDNHIDSFESFSANHGAGGNENHTITCADFVPFNTVRCASGEDTYKVTHMIIACSTQGDMRIFQNTAPPVKL